MQLTLPTLGLLAAGALAFPLSSPKPESFRALVGRVEGHTPQKLLASLPVPNSLQSRAGTTTGRGKIQFFSYWFTNVTAGNQNISLLLDTGSAVTPNTSASQNAGQAIYDPKTSTTSSRVAGETFDIVYSDGSVEVNGTVYTDNLCVGTACVNAPIGPAQYMTGFTPGSVKSGLMGLSFGVASQYSPTKLPTFMEAVQKLLPQPVFTANFRMDGTGSIDFGIINSTLYTGSLQPVAISNTTGSWLANNVAFYSPAGKQLGTNLTMNFDTGSPNTLVPNATLAAYYAAVPNATWYNNRWQFPCANRASLPGFVFKFTNGASATIPGSQMFWGAWDANNCTTWVLPTTGQGSMGDMFFNATVVVFNQSAPAVQFAMKSS